MFFGVVRAVMMGSQDDLLQHTINGPVGLDTSEASNQKHNDVQTIPSADTVFNHDLLVAKIYTR